MGDKTRRILIPVIGLVILLAAAVTFSSLPVRPTDREFRVSAEEAKKIALADSGENGDQVTFTRIKAEQEGKPPFYKAEFYTDSHEYKYEIDAESGEILNKESSAYHNRKEGQRESGAVGSSADQPGQKDNESLIGVKKAQQIALDSAGLNEKEVVFEKSRLGTEDGKVIYEIDFTGGRTEYEYDIDAYDGTVLEREIEELIPSPGKESVGETDDDEDKDDDEDDNDDEDNDDDEEEEDADDD